MLRQVRHMQNISIHALLAESDGVHYDNYNLHCVISIHALLAESDRQQPAGEKQRTYFYPRSPCGERQRAEIHASNQQEFLSTLSLRRATNYMIHMQRSYAYFYPRSPCGERLIDTIKDIIKTVNFYPRSPCGERRNASCSCHNVRPISIHALLAESDE